MNDKVNVLIIDSESARAEKLCEVINSKTTKVKCITKWIDDDDLVKKMKVLSYECNSWLLAHARNIEGLKCKNLKSFGDRIVKYSANSDCALKLTTGDEYSSADWDEYFKKNGKKKGKSNGKKK